MKIAVLAGDGIGREIIPQALKALRAVEPHPGAFEFREAPVGGAGLDMAGDALPPATLEVARWADAVLFGAVGDPRYDSLPPGQMPGSAIRRLRQGLKFYANLRPVKLYPELRDASTLKPEVIDGLDLLIVRELAGDVYYGTPRGPVENASGEREVVNTMRYTASEIERIGHVAFQAARQRGGKLCSVDKANVLEVMKLWREVMIEVGKHYPDVELTHLYVDAAAMNLMRSPRQFDVIVTSNLFGDILSDQASMLTGSIGLLPSASFGEERGALYEPIHGSAPGIAGQDRANPIAAILSAAMMLRHSFRMEAEASRIEAAVGTVLANGIVTADLASVGKRVVGTEALGDEVASVLRLGRS